MTRGVLFYHYMPLAENWWCCLIQFGSSIELGCFLFRNQLTDQSFYLFFGIGLLWNPPYYCFCAVINVQFICSGSCYPIGLQSWWLHRVHSRRWTSGSYSQKYPNVQKPKNFNKEIPVKDWILDMQLGSAHHGLSKLLPS